MPVWWAAAPRSERCAKPATGAACSQPTFASVKTTRSRQNRPHREHRPCCRGAHQVQCRASRCSPHSSCLSVWTKFTYYTWGAACCVTLTAHRGAKRRLQRRASAALFGTSITGGTAESLVKTYVGCPHPSRVVWISRCSAKLDGDMVVGFSAATATGLFHQAQRCKVSTKQERRNRRHRGTTPQPVPLKLAAPAMPQASCSARAAIAAWTAKMTMTRSWM